ncbi:methyltransferase [Nonomuraea sp. NPDC005983]|uniref:methyltransferase n=1 Tax=Nonomuraea sp. NPDC005983 TaxID=3155595 RepID=UPI0033BC1AD6
MTVTAASLIKTATGFYEAQALFAAVELGVFARVSSGPVPLSTLQDDLGLHANVAADFLDALVAMRLLTRTDAGYAATPAARAYLTPGAPEYIGGFLTLNQRRLYPAWGDLTSFLKNAENLAHGAKVDDPMPALYATPQRTRSFAEGMDGYATLLGRPLSEKFDWASVKSFADLGGCRGMLTTRVAAAHPHLQGVTFDLAPLNPLFDELVASVTGTTDLASRVRFQAGSFFTDPLPETEVYIIGHVLHDWVESKRREIIQRAYDHLPAGGTLLIYDSMIDDQREESAFGLLMSLNMALLSGASEYTMAQGQGWLREAGFQVESPVALNELTTLLIGRKPL